MPRTPRPDLATALDALAEGTREPRTIVDPIELRTITALVEEIERNRDALEAAVRAAREAGYSWSWIATCLRVSTQAAHQRYRHVG